MQPGCRQAVASHEWRPTDLAAYAYLLGVYLGDGHVAFPNGRASLRVYLDAAYPGIVDAVITAASSTLPGANVTSYQRRNRECVVVQASSPLWPAVFPQCGPGKKHERRIVLTEWQREITADNPDALIRGLIHSDGCRTVNRFSVDLPVGGRRQYEYVRYFFSNLSADIRAIFIYHCGLLGIKCTLSNHRNVSVSHRHSVEPLESFVGPKG